MKDCEFNNIKFYVGQSAKENWELLDIAKAENEDRTHISTRNYSEVLHQRVVRTQPKMVCVSRKLVLRLLAWELSFE